MHRDRFGSGWNSGGAEFRFAVMAENNMLHDIDHRLRDRLADHFGSPPGFLLDPDCGFHHMSDQLAGIGIAKACVVAQLPGLGDVVQEDASNQQIAI